MDPRSPNVTIGPEPGRRVGQLNLGRDEGFEVEMLSERGGKDQPDVGDQVVGIELISEHRS